MSFVDTSFLFVEDQIMKKPDGGSIIIINDTYSLYEDETVTVSVGTYSKTAVIEDGTATIKGFTETGTVTVSVSDFTKTFNIDKYSKYEVGVGSVGGFYEQWLDSIDESSASYSSLEDVLADEKMVRELFTRHASVDFLVDSVGNYPEELETIIDNDYCAKWINLRDYALDTLYANQIIALLMDQADKYFYGEWTIVDDSTTPPTWGPKGNVPVMTSNTAPYGKCIADSNTSGNDAFHVFDNVYGTLWASTKTGTTNIGAYVGYGFINPICVKRLKIRMSIPHTGAIVTPITFKLQGSNSEDSNSFIDIGESITLNNQNDYVYYNIDNSDYYLYYRVYIINQTHNTSSSGVIDFLQFYGRELRVSVPKMTSNTAPYYSEYDWDTDNPRHYIYDHGVELYALVESKGSSGSPYITKNSNSIEISSGSVSSSYAAIGVLEDLTPYSLSRVIIGHKFYYPNDSTIVHLSVYNNLSVSSYLANRQITYTDLLNSVYLDITSVNLTGYLCLMVDSKVNYPTEITELWLE